MGYNLYITRRKTWPDEAGPEISASQWLALVERDGELELEPANGSNFAACRRAGKPDDQWLDWAEGDLVTKNPQKWFVSKMIELAAELDARVVGDEGEEYTPDTLEALLGEGIDPTRRPLMSYWVAAPFLWVRGLLRHRLPKCPPPPFRVGDRVRDFSGEEATVIKLQRTAEFGYGKVRIQLGNGQQCTILFLDNTGLEPIEPHDG